MSNKEFINECFDIYMFNLVNSKAEIVFLGIDELGHEIMDIEWNIPSVHDDYLSEKLNSIKDENQRVISIGLDVFDNGTYWGIPVMNDGYSYYMSGATHRVSGLKMVRKLGIRNFKDRKFMCYNENKFINNKKYLYNKYSNIVNNDMSVCNIENRINSIEYINNFINTNYYIVDKLLIDYMEECIDKHFFSIIGTYMDGFYIVKSIEGLVAPLDILTATIKNKINEEGNIKPHPSILDEKNFIDNKYMYEHDYFFEKNKEKIKLF